MWREAIQIACPNCGSDVEMHLGIAPAVLQQAVRLQTAQHGAIAFCAACESYFVFGPGSYSELIAAATDRSRHDRDQGTAQTDQDRE